MAKAEWSVEEQEALLKKLRISPHDLRTGKGSALAVLLQAQTSGATAAGQLLTTDEFELIAALTGRNA